MSAAPGRPQASSHRSPQGEGTLMSTIVFLHCETLPMGLPWRHNFRHPTRWPMFPGVRTRAEVAGILAHMDGGATS